MRRPRLLRACVELFERDGSVIDVNDLHRRGAFSGPGMWFPFKRLKTFPDRLEIKWPDKNKPPVIVLIERTKLYLGGSRPWFICPRCRRRVGKLYDLRIDILCRKCYDLGYVSQRQRRKARLQTKAENIRNRLWFEDNKPIRPYYMHRATYQKHLRAISRIEHAIRHGLHCASIRYRRLRERDSDGRYCDEQADYEMI
jgi:hypothetical protein